MLRPNIWSRYYVAMNEGQLLMQAVESKDDTTVDRILEKARTELEKEIQSIQTACSSSLSELATVHSSSLSKLLQTQDTSESNTTCKQEPSLPSFLLPFTAGCLYTRLLSTIAEYLEKKGRYERANNILELLLSQEKFCSGYRGRWWERLTLNYDYHLKKKEKVYRSASSVRISFCFCNYYVYRVLRKSKQDWMTNISDLPDACP